MANNAAYWEKRFKIYEARANLKSKKHIQEMAKEYNASKKEIEKELKVFYNRLAANNDLSSAAAAKKLLNKNELADFKMNLKEYTRLAKENGITGDYTKMLENASLKYRISRLEAMKIQLEQKATMLMHSEKKGLEKFAKSAYENAYYNGGFEIAKGTGVGKSLFQIDDRKINTVIHRPWAADGKNFSQRVWGQHRPQLVKNLHRSLTDSITRGTGPDGAIKAISRDFDVSLSAAARIVQTEEAYFSAVAQRDVFKDLNVEKYQIIATLDSHTSETCQDLDGKVYKMEEYEAGKTAPPFHPRCRTTTAPYFDDEVGATRAARDPITGKTVQVPADMTYHQWKERFVVEPGSAQPQPQPQPKPKEQPKPKPKKQTEAEKLMYPEELAGIKRGKPMTRKEADSGDANFYYGTNDGYGINCQTCVVSFEARLRGYNVTAKPNTKGSMLEELSYNTSLAWIDPKTGTQPKYILPDFELRQNTHQPEEYLGFLHRRIKPKERYTFQFGWKYSRSGHIVSLDRDSKGLLRIYDPQIDKTYTGDDEIMNYLLRIKITSGRPPKILRIDNLGFNKQVVDYIFQESEW
jgi:SPP1 gp7 family putative phage head morphogenesis protein